MTKKAKLKLRDFARRHKLSDKHRDGLAKALENASAAQAEIILAQASKLLLGQRLTVRAAPPAERPEPRLVQPARLVEPEGLRTGLVDAHGRPLS